MIFDIKTDQVKISGDKGSTGNKGCIADKGPFINAEQGKITGDKGPTRHTGFIAY